MPRKLDVVTINGRDYRWPREPVVVICCDGSEPAYMEVALDKGLMPSLEQFLERGENLRGRSVIPSFTNPNNLSIVTGCPPAVHGISGNYFLDPETGEEVMMNDPQFLRAPTIFAEFQKAGAKVAVVTAKDKLRRLLGNGLDFAAGGRWLFPLRKRTPARFPSMASTMFAPWSTCRFRRFIRRSFQNSCSQQE